MKRSPGPSHSKARVSPEGENEGCVGAPSPVTNGRRLSKAGGEEVPASLSAAAAAARSRMAAPAANRAPGRGGYGGLGGFRAKRFESGDVAALGDGDADRVAEAFAFVVCLQLGAQPAGCDAHNRLGFRVVSGIAAEDFDADERFFEAVGLAFEALPDQELEEQPDAACAFEFRAGQNAVETGADQSRIRRGRCPAVPAVVLQHLPVKPC